MAPPRHTGGLVYSSELGRTCPTCRQSLTACRCHHNDTPVAGDGNVRVGRESKGRGGKVVTVVTGLPLAHAELNALATRLKKRCGTGGTVKDGVIEIQGEHRDVIVAELLSAGFKARKSGG
jgi:translation initiation factor 1